MLKKEHLVYLILIAAAMIDRSTLASAAADDTLHCPPGSNQKKEPLSKEKGYPVGSYEVFCSDGGVDLKEKRQGPYRTFYQSGIIRSKGVYKDGKVNGIVQSLDEKGRLQLETTFQNSVAEGPYKQFWPEKNGMVIYEGSNSGNKLKGSIKHYDDNGKLESDVFYNEGPGLKKIEEIVSRAKKGDCSKKMFGKSALSTKEFKDTQDPIETLLGICKKLSTDPLLNGNETRDSKAEKYSRFEADFPDGKRLVALFEKANTGVDLNFLGIVTPPGRGGKIKINDDGLGVAIIDLTLKCDPGKDCPSK